MSFSSISFLWIFLPLTFVGTYLLSFSHTNQIRLQNLFLLTASLFFYAWGDLTSVPFLLTSIVVGWAGGLVLQKLQGHKQKAVLILLVVAEIGVLFYSKYWNFFAENVSLLLGVTIPKIHNVSPIGISFIIFQSVSYIVDIYRGKSDAATNIISFGLYISFFPQIIMGPIVRYSSIEQSLSTRVITTENLTAGIKRFIIGLSKKVIIADCLGQMVDTILQFDQSLWCTWFAWLVFIGYSMQIYYDFSGYTDMALGLGRMFGFDLPENFNLPYTAKSVQEFWRRWHITLSNWFRDYVYIPLGGNRKGTIRTYINLSIVFLLTGLWHGASWNFLFWGAWHGMFMLIERKKLGALLKNCRFPMINYLYTLAVSFIGWMFFRITSLPQAFYLLKLLVVPTHSNPALESYYFINAYSITILIFAVILCGPAQSLFKKIEHTLSPKFVNTCTWIVLIPLFLYALSQCVASTYSAFIYEQF